MKTTEGYHYRRVILDRAVLERRGFPLGDAVPLGPTYRSLWAGLEPWSATSAGRRSPVDMNAGRGFVFVSHTGIVHPSGFLLLGAGSVRRQPLGEIYRESPLFRSLRNPAHLRGRCGMCEFASVCGGSRSRAFAASGDPLAEDPLCAYLPGTFPFSSDIAEALNAVPGGQDPGGPRSAPAALGGDA